MVNYPCVKHFYCPPEEIICILAPHTFVFIFITCQTCHLYLKGEIKKKTNPVILDLSIKGVLIKRNYVSTESTVKQASHPKIVLPLTSMGGKIELVITVE